MGEGGALKVADPVGGVELPHTETLEKGGDEDVVAEYERVALAKIGRDEPVGHSARAIGHAAIAVEAAVAQVAVRGGGGAFLRVLAVRGGEVGDPEPSEAGLGGVVDEGVLAFHAACDGARGFARTAHRRRGEGAGTESAQAAAQVESRLFAGLGEAEVFAEGRIVLGDGGSLGVAEEQDGASRRGGGDFAELLG